MRAAIAIILLIGGCASAPTVPKTVTVVVEKFRPLPKWATEPLVKPVPANLTTGAVVESHNARGAVIDLANCHRRLLAELDKGEPVDDNGCL